MPVLSWPFVADRGRPRLGPSPKLGASRTANAAAAVHRKAARTGPGSPPEGGSPSPADHRAPASRDSPIDPALRANPFSEVTGSTFRNLGDICYLFIFFIFLHDNRCNSCYTSRSNRWLWSRSLTAVPFEMIKIGSLQILGCCYINYIHRRKQ